MKDFFVFDGVSSREFGINLYDLETDNMPERIYKTATVAGRDGDVILDNGRYDNIEHGYDCIIYENTKQMLAKFRGFLASRKGFLRLEDSFHDDEFYMARFDSPLNVTLSRERDMAKFSLYFTRKPQRFLKSGEEVLQYSDRQTQVGQITDYYSNVHRLPSKPLLKIEGYGTLRLFGNKVSTVVLGEENADEPVFVDYDSMEIYTESEQEVSIDRFVEIPASNDMFFVTYSTTITDVEIIPRWYRV